jgi:hypothetical protein
VVFARTASDAAASTTLLLLLLLLPLPLLLLLGCRLRSPSWAACVLLAAWLT